MAVPAAPASVTPATASGVPATASNALWSQRYSGITLERVFIVVSPVLLLLLWEVLSQARVLDVRIFSRPTLVAGILWDLALDGTLWKNTSATLVRMALGMIVGVVPGLLLGLTMGLFRIPRAI